LIAQCKAKIWFFRLLWAVAIIPIPVVAASMLFYSYGGIVLLCGTVGTSAPAAVGSVLTGGVSIFFSVLPIILWFRFHSRLVRPQYCLLLIEMPWLIAAMILFIVFYYPLVYFL
jgi:hypothetical protein